MTQDKPTIFDAVAESRRWKETVAAQTAGMSIQQRMAWYRAKSFVEAIRKANKISSAETLQFVELENELRHSFFVHYDNGQNAEVSLAFI